MSFMKKKIGGGSGGFGATLRELRECRGYRIEDLSRMTGIHPLLLEAFEAERIETFADPIYAERHIRSLADALESRAPYLLEKYHELLNTRGASQQHAMFPAPRVRRRDLFVHSRALGFIGFLAVISLLAGYVFWQARIVASVPVLTVSEPREGALLTQSPIHIVGQTEPNAFATINGMSVVVNADGLFSAYLDVPNGLSSVRVEAKRRFGSTATIERHVTYQHP